MAKSATKLKKKPAARKSSKAVVKKFETVLVEKKDRESLKVAAESDSDQEVEDQQDAFAGEDASEEIDKNHETLTRLLCFDTFDIDGDGKTEDVMFWVILETRTLLRVRLLTEMYPGRKPERTGRDPDSGLA